MEGQPVSLTTARLVCRLIASCVQAKRASHELRGILNHSWIVGPSVMSAMRIDACRQVRTRRGKPLRRFTPHRSAFALETARLRWRMMHSVDCWRPLRPVLNHRAVTAPRPTSRRLSNLAAFERRGTHRPMTEAYEGELIGSPLVWDTGKNYKGAAWPRRLTAVLGGLLLPPCFVAIAVKEGNSFLSLCIPWEFPSPFWCACRCCWEACSGGMSRCKVLAYPPKAYMLWPGYQCELACLGGGWSEQSLGQIFKRWKYCPLTMV